MLDCVNVVKRYGGKFAVNGMSVAIEDAHIYGLLGPNGSGKSTWMKMAAGLIVPDEGEMTLDGVKISAETKKHIAYMPTEADRRYGSGDEYEGEKFILRYDGEAEDCCDFVKKGRAVSAG